ncbi:uncharacterized protein LOC127719805 [Mytilus californianus]|uniref:uncharacterized protein LOC127719805 n=1 Tax=Mytilus californianus TaxID=6549 RepID=UPI002246FA86|nr:uncharacterized protein LOC127719805 [Mytilus californianus]
MTFYFLYLSISLYTLITIGAEADEIFWEVLNPPIRFGSNVQLKCNIKCCLRNVTTAASWELKWPNKTHETISFDELSLKPSKYDILVGKDGCILVIKNFVMMDVPPTYICRFKFNNFSKSLNLHNEKFEMLPTPSTMKIVTETDGGFYNIIVNFFKVYPRPMCNARIKDRNITSQIKEQVIEEEFFYKGNYSLSLQIISGLLTMVCKIGESNFTIKEIEFVLFFREKDDRVVWIQREINVVLSSAIVILCSVVIFIVVTCWEKDFRYFRGWLVLLYFVLLEINPLPGGKKGFLSNEYPKQIEKCAKSYANEASEILPLLAKKDNIV